MLQCHKKVIDKCFLESYNGCIETNCHKKESEKQ
nr:MAG TPA: hypothetical protein [Caudoviricetes sp.]